MHELGILMGIIKTVENYAVENQVGKIEKLVLQIGEISSVIPNICGRFIRRRWRIRSLRRRSLRLRSCPPTRSAEIVETFFTPR